MEEYMYAPIIELVALCKAHGVKQVVISPGSRSAPLSLSFAHEPGIEKFVIPDERVAGHFALGLALASKKTVALVCTSGSAAYNLAPAVAEAFFQKVPLLVLTADRPAEWIGQQDGQAIYQREIYGKNCKFSAELPASFTSKDERWFANRVVNEALLMAEEMPKGPVHLNCPFREPFYPTIQGLTEQRQAPRVLRKLKTRASIESKELKEIGAELSKFSKIVVLIGQSAEEAELAKWLSKFPGLLIVKDVISNQKIPNAITAHDLFLGIEGANELKDSLRPDLLISIGDSLISKNLKLFLRDCSQMEHWQVSEGGPLVDAFFQLRMFLPCSPLLFFKHFVKQIQEATDKGFYKAWQQANEKALSAFDKGFNQFKDTELGAVHTVLSSLKKDFYLHLANSTAVRYANLVPFSSYKIKEVLANRGTSGIDGCTSTCIGFASNKEESLQVLITGDVAFFYDRNAFWVEKLPSNLRIVLINNYGGGIFRLIKGPSEHAELRRYFETEQSLDAGSLCEEMGLESRSCPIAGIEKTDLEWFASKSERPRLLELFSTTDKNKEDFLGFKKTIKELFGGIKNGKA